MNRLIACVFSMLLLTAAQATAPLQFLSAEEEQRFDTLIAELRCLVCQNQNLKDSDAPLARDLRLQVLEQIRSGRSDSEIKSYMVERYGNFVLYRPPLQSSTLLLWLGPALLLLLGATVLYLQIRQRARLARAEVESAAAESQSGLTDD